MVKLSRIGRGVLAFSAVSVVAVGVASADDEDLEVRIKELEERLDALLHETGSQADHLTPEETKHVRDVVRAVQASIGTNTMNPRDFGEIAPEVLLQQRPQGFMAGETEVIFGGYIKLDTTLTEFTGGDLPSGSLGRDFYIPAVIPVGGEAQDPVVDFNARETRFFFGFKNGQTGHDISGKIELDFMVTAGGDERVSNTYSSRIRSAFLTIDNWLFGQTWSTFQDVVALPDNLDFIGPTEGTTFQRHPQIRYSRGGFQIAIEQPETIVTTDTGNRLTPGDDALPDLALRYNATGDYGHLTLAGIVRQLKVNADVTGMNDETEIGWGISGSGKLNIGKSDDFRFMATYGDGVGRYVGVNIVNDVALNPDGSLETIPTLSGFASYRRVWNDKWRTNLTYGYFRADNPVQLTSGDVTDEVQSWHANLIYTVSSKVDVGIELSRADRELENGIDGAMNRLQFSARYGF